MTLLLVGFLAGVLLGTLEWRRTAPFPGLRAILALVTATALGGLAGAPTRAVEVRTDRILVTPHASAGDVDSARRLLPDAQVVQLADVRTPTALVQQVGAGHLLIVGDGPPAPWWPALASLEPAILAPRTPLPEGIAAIEAPARITLGEAWLVSGRIGGKRERDRWILATGPDEQRDSVQADSAGTFALSLRPRAAGAWSWSLVSGKDTSIIGVDVAPRRAERIILLAGSPSFELTALKRRLAERGDEVIMRVRSSKERVVTEYVNLPTGPAIPRIDAVQLRAADQVVIVGAVNDAVSTTESSTLLRAVRDGLGVIRVINSARDVEGAATDAAFSPGALQAIDQQQEQSGERTARVRNFPKSAPVPVVAARFGRNATILLRDDAERGLAAQRSTGEGRLVGTLITDAARWRTLGDTTTFDRYWRTLFDAAQRPARTTAWRPDGDARLLVNQLRRFSRFGTEADSGVAAVRWIAPSGQEDTLPLLRGADDPARRVIAVRPQEAGWHRIALLTGSDSAVAILVQNGELSEAQRAWSARSGAMHFARVFAAGARNSAPATSTTPWLPAWAWLLLATLSAGALWLLQRRDG